jgi:hypothetical protein
VKREVNLGPDLEIIFEPIKLNVWRDDIWMRLNLRNRHSCQSSISF